jgi:hypothetical protein
MRVLELSLAQLAAPTFEGLSRTLSSLEELTIETKVISGLTFGPGGNVVVRQRCNHGGPSIT